VLVFFGVYLFIGNSVFSNIVFTLKNIVGTKVPNVANQNTLPNFDVSSVKTNSGNLNQTGGIMEKT
jgi:hypothetical protein